MNVPNLPTDNLYKFLALAGLASLILSSWTGYDVRMRRLELRNRVRNESYQRYIDVVNSVADRTLKEFSSREERRSALEDSQHVVDGVLSNEFQSVQQQFSYIDKEVDGLLTRLSVMFWFGMVLCPTGFFFWWRKVQRHQDQILAQESDLAVMAKAAPS